MVIFILIGQIVWYFLPALTANMAPVFAAYYGWLEQLNIPLDGGANLRGKRLLGDNKTVRGLIIGLFIGLITGYFQYIFYPTAAKAGIALFSFTSAWEAATWGLLGGAGALLGDSIKSFIKRQRSIPSGSSWRPWDQLDSVLGVIAVTYLIHPLPLLHLVTALIVIGGGSWAVSAIGVATGIKRAL